MANPRSIVDVAHTKWRLRPPISVVFFFKRDRCRKKLVGLSSRWYPECPRSSFPFQFRANFVSYRWDFGLICPRGSGGFAVKIFRILLGKKSRHGHWAKDQCFPPFDRIELLVFCISREKISFVRKWRLKAPLLIRPDGGYAMHACTYGKSWSKSHGGGRRRLCTDGFVEVKPLPPSLTHR